MLNVWVFDFYFVNEKKVDVYYVIVLNKFMYIYLDGFVVYSMR